MVGEDKLRELLEKFDDARKYGADYTDCVDEFIEGCKKT
jgi:hypothetical protein